MDTDGIGTKVEVSERLKDHTQIARDLFAMACDDAVVRGGEPLALASVLDVRQLDDSDYTRLAINQLAEGYVDAAREAGVVVVNGETAELGSRVGGYGPFNYNWCATVLWAAHKDRLLTGHGILPGHTLVGLVEEGFRSNGITDVRNAMLEGYGKNWHDVVVPELGKLSLGSLVQKPSTIYSRFVTTLTGGFDLSVDPKAIVTGVSHITGGGQPSKLGRMLEPSGYGVIINDPIDPPEIMLLAQDIRGFSDRQSYGKWHMGPGMVIVTPEPNKVIAEATRFGILAKAIGEVTEEPGIKIRNRGLEQKEAWITF